MKYVLGLFFIVFILLIVSVYYAIIIKKESDIIQGLIPIEKNSQLRNRSWGLTITDEDKEQAISSKTEGATSLLVDNLTITS